MASEGEKPSQGEQPSAGGGINLPPEHRPWDAPSEDKLRGGVKWTEELELDLVPRAEWGAAPAKPPFEPLCTPVDNVLLTNTGGAECNTEEECVKAVKELQTYYMEEKGMADIPWNFLIGGDGRSYEGRGWRTRGTKLQSKFDYLNGISIDIAYIGNFTAKIPKTKMTLMAQRLITTGQDICAVDLTYKPVANLMDDFVETPDWADHVWA